MKTRKTPKVLTMLILAFIMVFSVACAEEAKEESVEQASVTIPEAQETAQPAGKIFISVNPEIEIEYDDRGLVFDIDGHNKDGKVVVESIDNFKGKSAQEVVRLVVQEIYKAGFFDADDVTKMKDKNIIVRLDDDSKAPYANFLNEIATEIQSEIAKIEKDSKVHLVHNTDLDDQGRINESKAKDLLLQQLGLTAAQVKFLDMDPDLDDGVYEFEFEHDGFEYEYEVNALTGKIRLAERDRNDDWNRVDRIKNERNALQESSNPVNITVYDDDDDWDDDDYYDDDYDDDDYYDDYYDDDYYDDDYDDDDHYDDYYDDDYYDDDYDDDDYYDDDYYDDDWDDDDDDWDDDDDDWDDDDDDWDDDDDDDDDWDDDDDDD